MKTKRYVLILASTALVAAATAAAAVSAAAFGSQQSVRSFPVSYTHLTLPTN